jgi:hypothetical protein
LVSNPRLPIALGLIVGSLSMAAVELPKARADERGDGVGELTKTLVGSRHEKQRIAAAVSLGRLRDRRALRPLLQGLRDRSRVVRAVSATALGHLGDPEALPGLRVAADDRDKAVRKRALAAIGRISAAAPPQVKPPRIGAALSEAKLARYQIAGREPPRLTGRKPSLYVVVKSAADDSGGQSSKSARKRRAAQMKGMVMDELAGTSEVTLDRRTANQLGLAPYGLDVSILKLGRTERGAWIEIECEIRIAISNQRGKMLSLLTGGAKVQLPRATFRVEYERIHQAEALENAVKSVYQDLLIYLRREAS